jgi:hypothetical protein
MSGAETAALMALAEQIAAYDPRKSMNNRSDEMPLDLAIAKAVGVAEPDWQVARGSVTGYFSGDGEGGFGNPIVLRYTRSLDDALRLVPEGLGVSMARHGKRGDDCSAYVGKSDSDARGNFMTDTFHGEAKTLPLAIVVACLKARAGRQPSAAQIAKKARRSARKAAARASTPSAHKEAQHAWLSRHSGAGGEADEGGAASN